MPSSPYVSRNQFISLSASPVITTQGGVQSTDGYVNMRNSAYRLIVDNSLAVTNPPFRARTAGRSSRLVASPDAPIVRGHIRRSSVTANDPTSNYRLYFMYNPELLIMKMLQGIKQ